ncbi:MAG: type transport system ATP-binding protein [Thermococcaceae archaeon]|nr:type transport system ATP-binding protein [Thermococcaceae archaeon]MDK2914058.1 type transport system ATP-binding protein [Thermococcaceae archaeon]
MIVIENLVKRYKDVTALQGLNLEVKPGQIYGFLGPNGAGKSTTILSTLGLIFPQQGRIQLFDLEVFRDGKYDEGKLVEAKRRIGYMPEHATLWDFLTPVQTLDIIADAFKIPKGEKEKRIRELIELVGLEDAKDRKVGKFSKGMRQRLLLAQALINDPDLLILDEPMNGLDPMGIAEFKDIIREQKKAGKTVFFSSHILAHVEEVCDTVGVIVKGRLVLEGSLEKIKEEFLKKAGYVIIIETNKPVDLSNAPWNVSPLGENKYRITASSDVREDVHDFITSKGAKILSMQVKEPSLEEIFLKVVE